MPKTDIYYIEVLGKALDILDVFAHNAKPALTLHEVSRVTKLNKNTVFRVLYTLGEHGYIVKRGHEYELGPRIADLGATRMRRRDLLAVAGPHLDALREQFHETVNLGVLDGIHIRYVDVRESHHRFRLAERVGGSDFLHCTALGKATLAFLPSEEVRRLLKEQGMPNQTSHTITTLSALKADLETIRQRGYALDAEESMEGAFCVAVPLLDAERNPFAAISISGPTMRFGPAAVPEASRALLETATQIRSGMGYE
jgi:DNA-binding IclR family transcriptional regulator